MAPATISPTLVEQRRTRAATDKVLSKDGTPIAYRRSGHGPPLVLVHGTTADGTRWHPILPAIEQRFTVYAVDRRGRGESGDSADYAAEREFDDVVAVVDAVAGRDGQVDLLGHSFGAWCSLEAALRTDRLRRLVLYEPPVPAGVEIYPSGAIDRVQRLIDQGQPEEALLSFFREVVKMPPAEIEMLRAAPNWPARVAAAYTIPRETKANEAYRLEPERFGNLTVPTLLLLGGDSPPFLKAATEAVHRALPNSRIAVLEGQQHAAINTAPDLFAREVLHFLRAE